MGIVPPVPSPPVASHRSTSISSSIATILPLHTCSSWVVIVVVIVTGWSVVEAVRSPWAMRMSSVSVVLGPLPVPPAVLVTLTMVAFDR